MFKIVKLVIAVLAVFAIYSATPDEQAEMYNGAKAFGMAVVTVCTRPDSLCTSGIAAARTGLLAVLKDGDPDKAPIGQDHGRYVEPPRQTYGTRQDHRDIYQR